MSENKSDDKMERLGQAVRAIREVCKHGSLRRKCEICDLQEDVERLERELNQAKAELDEYAKQAEGYKALLISETQRCDESRECLREMIEDVLPTACTPRDEDVDRWRKAAGLAE